MARSILHSSRRLTLLCIDNPGSAVPFFSNKCCSMGRADKQLPSLGLSDRKDHTLSHRASPCLSIPIFATSPEEQATGLSDTRAPVTVAARGAFQVFGCQVQQRCEKSNPANQDGE
ncbi:hypothetical protein BDQ94DRAFT_25656 [Aspergillus welwitschiae]|uniref:Uncharacterized protein n=1 Tax=Aspergillus welwitschiae TaxID=1341132 RepID=A0A3F3Q3H3_9EURO|nr:hypothetical protein BDQ94DRAFT_25656 [Aspergillus welwitschiae]RDH33733.1 hypothetical protein BDQ94DRAFT_25656 [Aspergillus welwitschiae]